MFLCNFQSKKSMKIHSRGHFFPVAQMCDTTGLVSSSNLPVYLGDTYGTDNSWYLYIPTQQLQELPLRALCFLDDFIFRSSKSIFVQELLWMAEADRWMCDQLNMSDFPPSSHMATSPMPADESPHTFDKYIGFIPLRRNKGPRNEPSHLVEFL